MADEFSGAVIEALTVRKGEVSRFARSCRASWPCGALLSNACLTMRVTLRKDFRSGATVKI